MYVAQSRHTMMMWASTVMAHVERNMTSQIAAHSLEGSRIEKFMQATPGNTVQSPGTVLLSFSVQRYCQDGDTEPSLLSA